MFIRENKEKQNELVDDEDFIGPVTINHWARTRR
jgi:hypothetical protein